MNRFTRRARITFKRALDDLIVLALTAVVCIVVLTYWVNNYSDVCNRRVLSTFRQDYITHVFNVENTKVILSTALADVGADLTLVDLYTPDYEYIVEYALYGTPEVNSELNTALIPIEDDLFFELRYEDQSFQRCSVATNGQITNPVIRDLFENDNPVKAIISCPFVDDNNFLLGSVNALYSDESYTNDDTAISSIEKKLAVYADNIARITNAT